MNNPKKGQTRVISDGVPKRPGPEGQARSLPRGKLHAGGRISQPGSRKPLLGPGWLVCVALLAVVTPKHPDPSAAPPWARDPSPVAPGSTRGSLSSTRSQRAGLEAQHPSAPRPANGSEVGIRPRPRRPPDPRSRRSSQGAALGAAGGRVGAEARAGEEAGLRPRPQARFRRARRGPWEAWPAGAGAAQPGTFRNCRRGRRRESPSRRGRSAESRAEAEPPRRAGAAEPQPELSCPPA